MFLVKGGTIKFDAAYDGAQCQKQTVQGIFVTDVAFGSDDNLSNNDLNKARCAEG